MTVSNRHESDRNPTRLVGSFLAMLFFVGLLLQSSGALALTINVVDADGNPITTGFRYLIEENNTLQTPPQVRTNYSIGTSIHKSHAPVVESGETAGASATASVPATQPYMVSVLPNAEYTISGANVETGQQEVTVTVNKLPLPTAQISVLIFNDNAPINNAPDAGEAGLANWKILVDDTAGHMTNDAFGNPLGTTYNPDGSVDTLGNGDILTDADGMAIIKNIAPGKYGVRAVPAVGQAEDWIQTATIEGTKTIDAWVKANEPETFVEGFGTGTVHVFIGFVDPDDLPWGSEAGGTPGVIDAGGGPVDSATFARLEGTVKYNHFAPPPFLQGYHPGIPVPDCMVGLNDPISGQGLIAVECDAAGNFVIDGVPPGTYELVTWDTNLDALFGFQTIVVHEGVNVVGLPPQSIPSLDVLSNKWFGELEGTVFYENPGTINGFQDPGEPGMVDQTVNIRYRDGSVYQSQATDPDGFYHFAEVFPFFKWLVVEVDFARFKATGMTAVVDAGGEVPGSEWPADGKRTPLPQGAINPNTGDDLSRTEEGEVLTQAMHLFLAQFNRIDWGKTSYGPGENGGISGMVFYAATRAEDDPKWAAGDPWEPGIPRVQVVLYKDADGNGVIDDVNGNGQIERADADNYPLGNFPGAEDVDNGTPGVFDNGDAVAITYTDSFDDSTPTDCIWQRPIPEINGQPLAEPCMDNFGVWNQIRPGVFDGGYAFTELDPDGLGNGSSAVTPMPAGDYIVQAVAPKGYVLQREQDKNVDFGDEFTPSGLALPPICVGNLQTVPSYMSFQTVGGAGETPLPGIDAADLISAPYAGQQRPLCDMKQVRLHAGQNAAAEFHFFTYVPKAARAVGFSNNDLGAEFDKTSPIYGEKPSPEWVPISFRDWAGNELSRVYTDEFGSYNAMLPSTYTNNLPTTMGMNPQMITVFLNHPWITDSATGERTLDPNYDPDFSQMAWTFMYYPGRTSYLDTPIMPVGAHVGYPNFGLDMEPADGTPVIAQVTGPASSGPVVRQAGDTLTITSVGFKSVDNPAASDRPEESGIPKSVTRDFGFGSVMGEVTVGGTPMTILSWTNASIQVAAPSTLAPGQLEVVRGDNNKATELGVTVHVVSQDPVYVDPAPYADGSGPIQNAIDAASDGDLIVVRPGLYEESPIVYKNVRLQGFGGESTRIYPYPDPLDKLADWHGRIVDLVASGDIVDIGDNPALLARTFAAIEMPGFMVLTNAARAGNANPGDRLVDGFSINGAISGGGIQVPEHGTNLKIANNVIFGNQGAQGGGIVVSTSDGAQRNNADIVITHNKIAKNSGRGFGGGGVTIYTGADNYQVTANRIAGNFTSWSGGGMAHYGNSDGGLIEDNKILFNEVFFGGQIGGQGGGLFISGEPVIGLGEGSGDVTVIGNLIQGNLAGSNSGGGIRIADVNGLEFGETGSWYAVDILGNIIVNNVAAYDGGGISLEDAVNVSIVNNTIANNDSTATSRSAFLPAQTISSPQGAGIVAWANNGALGAASGKLFADPALINNIVTGNRSFVMNTDPNLNDGAGELQFSAIADLAVTVDGLAMNPMNCVLTDATGYDASNIAADPDFVQPYENNLLFGVVIDEGGNNISARFYPLTETSGDYHIAGTSPAMNAGQNVLGTYPALAEDYDGQDRPSQCVIDIGADEVVVPCAADLNGDGMATRSDLLILYGNLGSSGPGLVGDLDCDEDVDFTDLNLWSTLSRDSGCRLTTIAIGQTPAATVGPQATAPLASPLGRSATTSVISEGSTAAASTESATADPAPLSLDQEPTDDAGQVASFGTTTTVLDPCAADLNGDGLANSEDLDILRANLDCTGGGCEGDMNLDGNVNRGDLSIWFSMAREFDACR